MCVCINGFKARNQKKPAIFSEAKDLASERQYNNPAQVLILKKGVSWKVEGFVK